MDNSYIGFVADAYRDAVLRNADMHAAVQALEAVRIDESTDGSSFRVWNALDTQIGITDGTILQEILICLRGRFVQDFCSREVEQLASGFSGDKDNAWDDWVRMYSEGLARWRLPICRALTSRDVPFSADVAALADRFARWTRYVTLEQWPYAFDLFHYLAAREKVPPDQRARFLVVAAEIQLFHFSDPIDVRALLEQAEQLSPQEIRVHIGWGEYFQSKSDKDGARRRFEKAIEINPRSASGYCALGELHLSNNDLSAAEASFQQAMQQDPGDSGGSMGLIRLYGHPDLLSNRGDRIPPLVRRTAAVDPDSEYRVYLTAGDAYQQNDRYDEAYHYYDLAITVNRDHPDAFLMKGHCLVGRPDHVDYAKARVEYEKAIRAAPEIYGGYYSIATIEESQGHWLEALRWYKESLSRGPHWAGPVKAKIGELLWRCGQHSKAETVLMSALRDNPDDLTVLAVVNNLATEYSCYSDMVQYLVQIFDQVLDIKGDSYSDTYHRQLSFVFNARGNALYEQGDYADAIEGYQKAIEHRPDDHVLHSNLAGAWEALHEPDHRLQELSEAIAARRRVCELLPEDADAAHTLAKLERQRDLVEMYGEHAETIALVTPIVVEVAEDLVARVDPGQDGAQVVHIDIPEMRDRIYRETGVEVPGVRLRPNPVLSPGTFQLLIDEVPVAIGKTVVGGAYCKMDLERLYVSEVPPGAILEVVPHPLTGESGAWIRPEDQESAAAEGLDLASDTEYILLCLEAVIHRNLARFVGMQEAQVLFERWVTMGGSPRNGPRAQGSYVDVEHARLLRTLVSERVSIADSDKIFEYSFGTPLTPTTFPSVLRGVRIRLKGRLPGNTPSATKLKLPGDIELKLQRRLVSREDGAAWFSVPPKEHHELLLTIRDLLPSHGRQPVLVVEDPQLRPYLRRLVEPTFPDLMVLSLEELMESRPSEVASEGAVAQGGDLGGET
jgi:tetratricopeptide (TPR) repeat protein